jgi:hypothetical protein
VDDKWEHVLDGEPLVALIDFIGVYLCADEDELHHDDGHQVYNPAGVVVEQEQLGLVEGLSRLHQALMLALYHIPLCVVVLHEHLAVVLMVLALLAVLNHLRNLHPSHCWRRLAVDLVKLNFLEHDLGVVVLAAFAARHKAEAVRLDDCHHDDVGHRCKDDAHGREYLAVGVYGGND